MIRIDGKWSKSLELTKELQTKMKEEHGVKSKLFLTRKRGNPGLKFGRGLTVQGWDTTNFPKSYIVWHDGKRTTTTNLEWLANEIAEVEDYLDVISQDDWEEDLPF